AVHAHVLGCLRDVALVAGQGIRDELTLETLDDALLGILEASGRFLVAARVRLASAAYGPGEVVQLDLLAGGQGQRLLQGVLQLPHVARPVVYQEPPVGGAREPAGPPPPPPGPPRPARLPLH